MCKKLPILLGFLFINNAFAMQPTDQTSLMRVYRKEHRTLKSFSEEIKEKSVFSTQDKKTLKDFSLRAKVNHDNSQSKSLKIACMFACLSAEANDLQPNKSLTEWMDSWPAHDPEKRLARDQELENHYSNKVLVLEFQLEKIQESLNATQKVPLLDLRRTAKHLCFEEECSQTLTERFEAIVNQANALLTKIN